MKKLLSLILGIAIITTAIFAVITLTSKPVIAPGGGGGGGISCTDGDGADPKPFYYQSSTSGTDIFGTPVSFIDTCVDSGNLAEGVCIYDTIHNGYYASYITTNCSRGCINGACQKGDCTDTDGGNDIYNYGMVFLGTDTYPDSCDADDDVHEYFCNEDGELGSRYAYCGIFFDCLLGECVSIF